MDEWTRYLSLEMEKGKFPSAVLELRRGKEVLLKGTVGSISQDNIEVPDEHTLYDLASLTKVVATLPSILYLIDNKELNLDTKICSIFPEFNSKEKEEITIQNLLVHTAGFKSYIPFYKNCKQSTDFDVVKEVSEIPLEHAVNTKVLYSDFGFMLLGKIIEKISNKSLDKFVVEKIFNPLSMTETCYKPYVKNKMKIAPTSTESLGIVHDENTKFFGGISGHAGLFSTLNDLNKYIDFWRNKGRQGTQQIISEELIEKSIANQTGNLKNSRGLGWVRQNNSMGFFERYSEKTFGHTGFTGTSMMIDPVNNCSIILLTNRVYMGRDEEFLFARKRIHHRLFTDCLSSL